jgi:Tfp pilus assembly protein FimV
MAPLFGGKDEMKEVGQQMQNLSDQIGALQKQLDQKNAEVDNLQQSLSQAQSQASQDAQAQSQAGQDAQQQVTELKRKLAEAQATKDAEAMANDMMLNNMRKQMDALRKRMEELQSQPASVSGGVKLSSGEDQPQHGGLAVGGSAWVTRAGGLPLRLRSGPSLEGDVLDRLQPGTQMTLLEGPRQADGHAWWHIRTTDNREGWVAGEELRTQPD